MLSLGKFFFFLSSFGAVIHLLILPEECSANIKWPRKFRQKKTWEGFAGGVFFTLILGYFIEQKFPDLRGNWIVVGLLVSIFAPLGDLVESQLKRTFGVKDSGNIIPGHGGVLDRLDSFIIAAPVVYLYFILENIF